MNSPSTRSNPYLFFIALVLGHLFAAKSNGAQEDDIIRLRQKAISRVAKLVEPKLVQLDVFSETRPKLKVATATLISAKGEMITSSYFVPSPDTQLTANWRNEKRNVKIVARDLNLGLVLLQMETEDSTPFVSFPRNDCQIGQTAIAHGRTQIASGTHISVGIVSAIRRVWGRAIQTDAKTSPANYGGLLTDLQGKSLGVLTSLSPEGNTEADAEWYDSGIGFAIPSVSVANSIRLMRQKGNLSSGKTGIQFQASTSLRGSLKVAHCYPRSPAALAGIRPNDLLTHVNNTPVFTTNQFKQLTHSLYAGDRVSLKFIRDESTRTLSLTLDSKLSIYKSPYLGILPDPTFKGNGVKVRQVDKQGPLGTTISTGTVITTVDGHQVEGIEGLRKTLGQYEAGASIMIQTKAGENITQHDVQLGELIGELATDSFQLTKSKSPVELQKQEFRVSGFENGFIVWRPAKRKLKSPVRCVVLLATSSKENEGVANHWKNWAAETGNLAVLLFPREISGWQSDEKEFVTLALRKLNSQVSVEHTNYLIVRERTTSFGMDLFREQLEFRGFLLDNPIWEATTVVPFSRPGSAAFFLIHTDKAAATTGVKLQRRLLQNGIPTKLIVRESPGVDKKLPEAIQKWLLTTDRI